MTEHYEDFEISELRFDFPTLIESPKTTEFGKRVQFSWDTERPRDAKLSNIMTYV